MVRFVFFQFERNFNMKRSSLTPSPSVTKRCRSGEIYNADQARNFIIDSDDELDFEADYPDSELEEVGLSDDDENVDQTPVDAISEPGPSS
ncbi:hypothetical protein ElyMa_003435700 [Elysia marginata]|uniref:Uncharacterized protein n=1 Tax=Elysia marginata TaxID=1093978 RepID=A0AAV4JWB1_9GAST|nr:hypothetical protein ElyMa_003435700 [Elysia marginata]